MKILVVGTGYLGRVIHQFLVGKIKMDQVVCIGYRDLMNLSSQEILNEYGSIDYMIYATGPGHSGMLEYELNQYRVVANKIIHQFNFCKRIVISSAGVVYGEGKFHAPFAELDPLNLVTPYAKYQHFIEQSVDGSRDLVIRLSNPYGPLQLAKTGQGFISTVIKSIQLGTPMTIYGNGEVMRDYIYDDDFASAIFQLCDAGVHGVYNLGSGVSHTQLDVITEVEEMTRKKLNLIKAPFRESDLMVSHISIDKIKNEINFFPKFNMHAGIEKFLKHAFN